MLIRLEALELAANAASSDANDRYVLDFIQVRANGDVVVTDGHHFLRLKAAVEEPTLFDALLPKAEVGAAEDTLVNAEDAKAFKASCKRAIKKAAKGAKKGDAPAVHVAIAKGDEAVTLATADGVTSRRFEMKERSTTMEYPNVDRVIPKGAKHEILLSVELMMRVLRTLKALKCRSVSLALTKDSEAAIVVRATSVIGDIDGAIMPMRDSKEKAEGEAA
jgi:hypothetical protein